MSQQEPSDSELQTPLKSQGWGVLDGNRMLCQGKWQCDHPPCELVWIQLLRGHGGSSRCGSVVMNPAMRIRVWSQASLRGLRIWPCSELWCKLQTQGSDPVLQWLWHRLAAAVPIRPLAWKLPYAAGAALKKKEKKKKKKRKKFMVIWYFSISKVDKLWFADQIQPIVCFCKHIFTVGFHGDTSPFQMVSSPVCPWLKRNPTNFPLSWWKSVI